MGLASVVTDLAALQDEREQARRRPAEAGSRLLRSVHLISRVEPRPRAGDEACVGGTVMRNAMPIQRWV